MKVVTIQNTGKQHVITIPKSIVDKLKLEKGEAVTVKEVENKIIIEKINW